MWLGIILLILLCLLVVLISSKTQQMQKRGCGRGCATCGNRFICHKDKYPQAPPTADPSGRTAEKKHPSDKPANDTTILPQPPGKRF